MAHSLHNVLEAACKALKVDISIFDHGVKPLLYNRTYVDLAIWIAEQAKPHIEARERSELEVIIVLSRRVAAGEKLDKASASKLRVREPSSVRGQNLISALMLETLEAHINGVCGKGSRQAAAIAAHLLGRPFLDALSEEILRLDAVTTIARQELVVSSAVTACLWRGATGVKATHSIVRLADGSYGLIAKTKGRWTWLAGERDDVLASVPDAQMESAVSALLSASSASGEAATPASKASRTAKKDKSADDAKAEARKPKVAGAVVGKTANVPSTTIRGVAIGPDTGVPFATTRDGALISWGGDKPEFSDAEIGLTEGMDAGTEGAIATWGNKLTRWRGSVSLVVVESIDEKVDGAIVTSADEGHLVWWQDDQIQFGTKKKKKIKGLAHQQLSFDCVRRQIVAAAPSGCRRFTMDGVVVNDLEIAAPEHVLSPDGERIATWKPGAATRSVLISSAVDGKTLQTLALDSGHVDMVVFTDGATGGVLVRYHEKKRVAAYDARGVRTHRIAARDLGSTGSAVEELFPLSRGAVLAFAPYPRGDMLLLDLGAQLIERWQTRNFYRGGKSYIAEGRGRVLFAHSRERTTCLLRL